MNKNTLLYAILITVITCLQSSTVIAMEKKSRRIDETPQEILNAALIEAVRSNNITEAAVLLCQGADIQTHYQEPFTSNRLSILYLAVSNNNTLMTRFLFNNGYTIDQTSYCDTALALCTAVINDNPEIVELLLAHGVYIDCQIHGGFTALHQATIMHNAAMVKLLLNHFAEETIRTNGDQTALDIARLNNSHDIIALLTPKH